MCKTRTPERFHDHALTHPGAHSSVNEHDKNQLLSLSCFLQRLAHGWFPRLHTLVVASTIDICWTKPSSVERTYHSVHVILHPFSSERRVPLYPQSGIDEGRSVETNQPLISLAARACLCPVRVWGYGQFPMLPSCTQPSNTSIETL